MENYKSFKKFILSFLISVTIVSSVNTSASPFSYVSISGDINYANTQTYFFDSNVLNIETSNNISMWNFLEISFNDIGSLVTFYEFEPIDTTTLTYYVNRVLNLALSYQNNPLGVDDLEYDPLNPNFIYPYHMPIIGPTMHQSIFLFEGGLTYRQVSAATPHSHLIPIIGLRPENYGTINYNIIRAVEEMERLRALEGTLSSIPSSFHESGFLPFRFGDGFNPSVLYNARTGFDDDHGMNTPMLDMIIHALAALPASERNNRDSIINNLNNQVNRVINDFSAFNGGSLERVPVVGTGYLRASIPITLTNGAWLTTNLSNIALIINYASSISTNIYIDNFSILSSTLAVLEFIITEDYAHLKFPLAVYNTRNDARIYISTEGSSFENLDINFPFILNYPITAVSSPSAVEDFEDDYVNLGEGEAYYSYYTPPRRERRRAVVVITPYGRVTIGGDEYIFDPAEFGAPHINARGVSVMPARRILSILLDEDPHDDDMFIWDGVETSFKIDPYGYDILYTVNVPFMRVNGIIRPIFSGFGERAFLVSPYIDVNQNERLFVPTRTIAEVLGFRVYWDSETANVTLVPIEL